MEFARKAVLKAKVFYQDLNPIVTIDEAFKKKIAYYLNLE